MLWSGGVTVTAARAYLALGSNLGDRLEALDHAVRELEATPGVRVAAASEAYETEPWGVLDQPCFANAVVEVESELDPFELLARCKEIEAAMGRQQGERFGPRPIDIDVLLFDGLSIDTPDLIVPHPRMLERDFVVTPLLEIAPDIEVPRHGRPDPTAATEGRVSGVLGPFTRR